MFKCCDKVRCSNVVRAPQLQLIVTLWSLEKLLLKTPLCNPVMSPWEFFQMSVSLFVCLFVYLFISGMIRFSGHGLCLYFVRYGAPLFEFGHGLSLTTFEYSWAVTPTSSVRINDLRKGAPSLGCFDCSSVTYSVKVRRVTESNHHTHLNIATLL
jgi:hypothetical protein